MNEFDRKQLCRELRHRQTPAEEIFWQVVRNRRFEGLKFRRQHPIGKFVADFYCAEHRMAIELDGGVHKETQGRDEARDEIIKVYGVRIDHIRNEDFVDDPEETLDQIRQALASVRHPSPSEMERGRG